MTPVRRASLPMYDLPAVRAATDAWWQGLAGHLRTAGVAGVPDRLAREPAPQSTAPDLLLSQTCGYPLTHALAGEVEPLCTPVYGAPGCRGPRYVSALVVRADSPATELADLRGGVCAFNNPASQSGYNVLRRMVAPLAGGAAFFDRTVATGGHAASVAAVGAGEADLCAVDSVTHALLGRHAPTALAGTRVLGHSLEAPGLPVVTGPAITENERARIQAGVQAAVADPGLAETRAALLLEGVEAVPLSAYDEIVVMEEEAAALGYPELR
jgi:ABC-type phosphate/phosphonate transport system substrate-binding protein